MKLHKNAALTLKQRHRIQELYSTGNYTQQCLAQLFGVNRKMIIKWINRTEFIDKSSHSVSKPSKLTTAFMEAVQAYREDPLTSHHGKVRIAYHLAGQHSCSNPSNVYNALKQLQLNQAKKGVAPAIQKIPVGKHRTQMDIQQLPAIKGKEGFEYKISIIHLSTRLKYSEIHADYARKTIAQVYQRALDNLPPFS